MSTVTLPDLESASAEEVLAYAVEHFPGLRMACSFQKEESVLVHMLTRLKPGASVFTIDTGVLFPETLTAWKAFEDRFGVHVDVFDATNPEHPWTGGAHCCGTAKVAALESALAGADAWVTGVRREQATTRASAAKVERDEKRGIVKFNPLADWTDKDVWRYIHAHDLPYHELHDQGYDSIGCAPCTQPGSGRDGRWAGDEKTECGIHV